MVKFCDRDGDVFAGIQGDPSFKILQQDRFKSIACCRYATIGLKRPEKSQF